MAREKDFERAVGHLYADALMNLAKSAGPDRIAELRDELDALRQLLRADSRFRSFCNSVVIDKEERKASLRKIFSGQLSPELFNLLLVLCDHDRLMCLDEVCDEFQHMRDAQLKRAHVDVTTAVPLDEDLRAKLVARLSALLGKQPILTEHVKPGLLAGLVVQYEDWRADASAARKLTELNEQMRLVGTRQIARGTSVA